MYSANFMTLVVVNYSTWSKIESAIVNGLRVE